MTPPTATCSSAARSHATAWSSTCDHPACSFEVGQVTGITGIGVFARVWTWLAVTVSLFVLAGLIRRSWHVLSG